MINEEILSEKLKYLISMESKSQFEIFNLSIQPEFYTEEKNSIESYIIDIKFDYDGVISSYVNEFIRDIASITNKIKELLSKYTITSEGKLISGTGNSWIDDGMIFELDYDFEAKHIFNMSFRVSYND